MRLACHADYSAWKVPFINNYLIRFMWMAENPDARLKTGGAGRNRAQRMYDRRVKAKVLAKIWQAMVSCSNTDLEALKMNPDVLKI